MRQVRATTAHRLQMIDVRDNPWEHIPFWIEPADYALMRANVKR